MNQISLPEFSEIKTPSAWRGADLIERSGEWQHFLTDKEIAEIERAVMNFENSAADLKTINPTTFPLPTFCTRLAVWLDEILHGRGFVLLRGLPVERWTRRQAAIAFLGIGSYFGNFRPQNANGHLLGHVKDVGLSSDNPNARIYQTRERQTFHTDSCDVVGLLCLQKARRGGLSAVVSAATIFNEMLRTRPDLLAVLFEPIETDRRGETAAGEKPYFEIPIFNWHAGLLSVIYQRQYIESARRFADVPPLTEQQIAALDLFDSIANDPKLNLLMELEPGDIQLLHNHALLHDRTAFEDYPEPERKRHLLRLWLAPATARPLPKVFAERFGSIEPGRRGGISVAEELCNVPLDVS
jgi:hypothetical protein